MRFGVFDVDVRAGELRRAGHRVRIQEKPFQLLCALLERPGEVVGKDELQERLWPDVSVDADAGLGEALFKLRKALGDSAQAPRYIETIPRRGYRFIAAIDTRGEADSQSESPASPKKRPRAIVFVAVGALMLTLLGLGLWPTRQNDGPPKLKLTQLTKDLGTSADPALSADGALLAFASDREGGNIDIWVQHTSGGEPLRITEHPAADFHPTFSPTGDSIVFRSNRDGGGLYLVPSLGGSPRRLTDFGNFPTFSPDGRWISFSTITTDSDNRRRINAYFVPATGGEPQKLDSDLEVASPEGWSSDGEELFVIGAKKAVEFGQLGLDVQVLELDWWIVPRNGGTAKSLGARDLFRSLNLEVPTDLTWAPGGEWLVYSTKPEGATIRNLWRIRISKTLRSLVGDPQRLTAGTGEHFPSAASNGRIAFMSSVRNWDIWRLPIDASLGVARGEPERFIGSLATELYPYLALGSQKLAYTSDREGNRDIWLRDLGTGTDTRFTLSPDDELRGAVSPDGSRVAFRRGVDGKTNIYVATIGRAAEQLLLEDVGSHMDWTPDGTRLVYYTNSPIEWWTIDVSTNERVNLGLKDREHPVHNVLFSPDQQWLLFTLKGAGSLHVAQVEEGRATRDRSRFVRVLDETDDISHPWWSPDGNLLYFISPRDGSMCIWAQRLDPMAKHAEGEPFSVLHLHDRLSTSSNAAFGFAMSPDMLYLPLMELKANVWLAELTSDY